jgi:hypothetical protein
MRFDPSGGNPVELFHPPQRDSTAVALIGNRGITETVTQDDEPFSQKRLNHFLDMLSSRSLVKKELIHGDDITMSSVQQNPSDLFADTSPARLPRRNAGNAFLIQVPLQAPDLRSLPAAFHTLQGDQ